VKLKLISINENLISLFSSFFLRNSRKLKQINFSVSVDLIPLVFFYNKGNEQVNSKNLKKIRKSIYVFVKYIIWRNYNLSKILVNHH